MKVRHGGKIDIHHDEKTAVHHGEEIDVYHGGKTDIHRDEKTDVRHACPDPSGWPAWGEHERVRKGKPYAF
jgi:hypothetical protein